MVIWSWPFFVAVYEKIWMYIGDSYVLIAYLQREVFQQQPIVPSNPVTSFANLLHWLLYCVLPPHAALSRPIIPRQKLLRFDTTCTVVLRRLPWDFQSLSVPMRLFESLSVHFSLFYSFSVRFGAFQSLSVRFSHFQYLSVPLGSFFSFQSHSVFQSL